MIVVIVSLIVLTIVRPSIEVFVIGAVVGCLCTFFALFTVL